jgi:hypothetical protein
MRTPRVLPQQYEFYFSDLDNLILVESSEECVLIRSTRDNVPERRKLAFVRRLAAEGFIPDCYQWCTDLQDRRCPVDWVIDTSWLSLNPRTSRRATRFIKRLLLMTTLAWIVLISFLFLSQSRLHPAPHPGAAAASRAGSFQSSLVK